jgi:hypothetical protein
MVAESRYQLLRADMDLRRAYICLPISIVPIYPAPNYLGFIIFSL